MNSRLLRLMVVVALLLTGGCANMNPFLSTQTTLLEEYRQVRSWSAAQTEGAIHEREQLYARETSEINRLALALALGFGKGTAADPRRALQLFDESIKAGAGQHSDTALFAEVFAGILKERLQAEAKIGAAEAKASAAEVKASASEAKANAAEAKAGSLNRQLESEREQADELQKKLEALKAIEKSLRKR